MEQLENSTTKVEENLTTDTNKTTEAFFSEKKEEKITDDADNVVIEQKKELSPIVEPAKNTTKKNKPKKNKTDKEIFTMAATFSKDEYEKIIELFNARQQNKLSTDRNQFFRQLIQFACNAHTYKEPKFGMPENFYLQLKNTF